MIYRCRLNRVRPQHLYAALLSIVGLYLLSQFDIVSSKYWWAYSIGITLAIGLSYLVGNTKIRIEINGKSVIIEHSGMVYANFPVDSIDRVVVNDSGGISRIVVVTNEGLKYYIPCECFSNTEIETLLKALRKQE
jgi:hypothetical protein